MGDWKIVPGLKYARTDEWVKLLADGEALVGISDYAQDSLSDLVYVELPEVGTTFLAGEEFGAVESVKASAPINMPADGEILEVNAVLEDTPELINEDPYERGWIVKIKITDDANLAELMDEDAYTAYSEERG